MNQRGEDGGYLKNKTRVSKKDAVPRNFICGCGKTYLSYPALYTHIKNKHRGIAPDNTTLDSQNKPKRPPGESLIEPSELSRTEMPRAPTEEPDEPLREPEPRKKATSAVPARVFAREEVPPVKGGVFEFAGSGGGATGLGLSGSLAAAFARVSGAETVDLGVCVNVFAFYLLQISKQASPEFAGFASAVFRALTECLNLFGYSLLTKFEQAHRRLRVDFKGEIGDTDFAEKESTDYVAISFDFFVKKFLANYWQLKRLPVQWVLQLLLDFNDWMVTSGLSKISLTNNFLGN